MKTFLDKLAKFIVIGTIIGLIGLLLIGCYYEPYLVLIILLIGSLKWSVDRLIQIEERKYEKNIKS